MARFPIQITAEDRTKAVIDKVGAAFGKLTHGTSFERVGKAFEGWAKSGRSIGDAWKAIGALGDEGAAAAGGLEEAAAGATSFGVAAGGLALGVGAVAVGFGVATEKAFQFEVQMSKAGREVGITSRLLGLGAQRLQVIRGAAELAGVPVDQTTASLQGLGQTLNDARWGRNNQALALWTQMGLKIRTLKDGSVDTEAAVLDLAGALQRYPAQTRAFIAAQFGVAGALPFFGQGRAKILADMEAYQRAHAAMTDGQISQSDRFQRSLTDLDFKWRSLKNHLSENIVFPWVDPLVKALSSVVGWFDDAINAKLTFDRVMKGAVTFAAFGLGGPGAAAGAAGLYDQGRKAFGGPPNKAPQPGASPTSPPAAGGNWWDNAVGFATGLFDRLTHASPQASTAATGAVDRMEQFAGGAFDRLAQAIERQESGHRQFDRRGRTLTSSAGAMGVMQMLPATAAEAARRLGIQFDAGRFMRDASYNRMLGREELRFQLQKWGGDAVLASAAYNAGPAAVQRWIKRFGDPRKGQITDKEFAELIPFRETRGYVAATAGRAGVERVAVDVHLHNAPRGTVARVNGGPNVDTNVRIGHTLQTAGQIAMAGA